MTAKTDFLLTATSLMKSLSSYFDNITITSRYLKESHPLTKTILAQLHTEALIYGYNNPPYIKGISFGNDPSRIEMQIYLDLTDSGYTRGNLIGYLEQFMKTTHITHIVVKFLMYK